MSQSAGLHRMEAAAFVSRQAGYYVPEPTLRFWEGRGLLPKRGRGRRTPAPYNLRDLVTACIVAGLRRDGAPLQRVRKAHRELTRLLPALVDRPGEWRLAVTGAGDVVRVESDQEVIELSRRPGQLAFFDVGAIAREARAELQYRA